MFNTRDIFSTALLTSIVAAALAFAPAPAYATHDEWVPPEKNSNTSEESAPKAGNTATGTGNTATGAIVLSSNIPRIAGPRRTISVAKFDAVGSFTAKYGNWEIGGGVSAMLTTALVESKRFIVIERAILSQMLTEQELKTAGLTAKGAGAKLGRMLPVQLLVVGSVTEFGTRDQGSSVGVGFAGGTLGGLLGAGLSASSASGSVAVDMRLVEVESGAVIQAFTVREPISSTGLGLTFGYRGISLGGNRFWKTPLGAAMRAVINKAVQRIAGEAGRVPWSGRVVDIDKKEIYINAGARAGVKPGDMFMVERVLKIITDPDTGEILSVRRKELGIVRVTNVEKKLAIGRYSPLEKLRPKRGDTVVEIRQ